MRVGELNREFEQTGRLPPEVWDEWLWGTDPDEAYEPEILLNKNHLLGVLICRFKGRSASQHKGWACGRLEIMDKHPSAMSWRELKDTLTNAQLEWPAFLERLEQNENAVDNLRAVKALVDASAARFGSLCGAAWGDDVLDDMSDAQPCGERKSLTPGAMRRTAGLLLVMYRHLHWLATCRPAPASDEPIAVASHHYEASMSQFYLWHMHFQLPVAARLNYRHDFPGMYNHVTQPVYFHNPNYQRTKRLAADDAPAIHVLPSLCQLYPELPVCFEDELLRQGPAWHWLVTAGRIYLCGPGKSVYYSRDARALLAVYLAQRGT